MSDWSPARRLVSSASLLDGQPAQMAELCGMSIAGEKPDSRPERARTTSKRRGVEERSMSSTVNGFDEREPDSQVVEGHVTEIDHDAGRLLLSTDGGIVPVQASPRALENVQVGDRVQVHLVPKEEE
jgi:hypothetical protein